VVVAVGLMLVEPLAAVDVNVPGVTAILVAPVAAQFNVLLAPLFMLVGFAVNEVIVGAEPCPEDELDEVPPQPARTTQTKRTIIVCRNRIVVVGLKPGDDSLLPTAS
jgi:hypothetical protein